MFLKALASCRYKLGRLSTAHHCCGSYHLKIMGASHCNFLIMMAYCTNRIYYSLNNVHFYVWTEIHK